MHRKGLIYGIGIPVMLLILKMLLDILFQIGRRTMGMDSVAYTSMAINLLCAVLTLSVFISAAGNARQERLFMRLFLWMLALNTLALVGTAVSRGIGFGGILASRAAVSVGCFITHASGYPLIVLFSIYLLSYIDEDPKELKRYSVLIGGLSADGFLLVILSCFTADDPQNPWEISQHPWVSFFFIMVPLVVCAGIILNFRKKLTNRKALTFLSFELITVGAIVANILLGGMGLDYVTVSLMLLLIYINVQTEYEKQKEQELAQQRIAIMLSQIHPHFLYNVLTGIKSLCRTDSEKAEMALISFTAFLRGNLNSLTSEDNISFLQELENTKQYIYLEKMRFGDDLKVVFDTPVTSFWLPPLSLQPIVENAVSHGVMRRENGGTVRITTVETDKEVQIIVSDDGPGFDAAEIRKNNGDHVGIANVQERLRAFCGGTLEIESAKDSGTTVTMMIPKKRQGGL